MGDSVRFEQIDLGINVLITGDAHQVVCSVRGKAAEEELAVPAAAEPEVAKKGKKEDKK